MALFEKGGTDLDLDAIAQLLAGLTDGNNIDIPMKSGDTECDQSITIPANLGGGNVCDPLPVVDQFTPNAVTLPDDRTCRHKCNIATSNKDSNIFMLYLYAVRTSIHRILCIIIMYVVSLLCSPLVEWSDHILR